METKLYNAAGASRNDNPHHVPMPPTDLTPAGRVVWLRTRRASATCNLLACIAGFGPQEAR